MRLLALLLVLGAPVAAQHRTGRLSLGSDPAAEEEEKDKTKDEKTGTEIEGAEGEENVPASFGAEAPAEGPKTTADVAKEKEEAATSATPAAPSATPGPSAPASATRQPDRAPVQPRANAPMGNISAAVAPPAPKPKAVTCNPPNVSAAAKALLLRPGMAEAFRRMCRNNTDWTYFDALIDELRKRDGRWGYWCRRGKCGDPSHDVLAYYCGPGKPFHGADAARGIDFVVASCYDSPEDGNPSIGWGVLEPNDKGVPAWTTRGRFIP